MTTELHLRFQLNFQLLFKGGSLAFSYYIEYFAWVEAYKNYALIFLGFLEFKMKLYIIQSRELVITSISDKIQTKFVV